MSNIKIRKVSKHTYKEKKIKVKVQYKLNVQKTKDKYNKKLEGANTKQAIKVIKHERKLSLAKQENRYAFQYNAIVNEELYRKGILESKIDDINEAYKRKSKHDKKFDKVSEKEIRNKKIESAKNRYSKPVSADYRASKTSDIESNLEFVKVPIKSPGKRMAIQIALIFLAALITTIALDMFIKPFGIYNAGLRGITQTIYYVIKHFDSNASTSVSYALFFAVNIPLAIFGYFKVGKKFTIYTLLFIAMQYGISTAIDYSTLEQYIQPFGKTAKEIENMKGQNHPVYNYALPFIAAFIGSVLYGLGVGVVYKAKGSTGGSKFVVTYISAKKGKSVGTVAKIFAIFVIFQGILVNHIIIEHEHVISAYTSTTLFASAVFVYMSNWALDKVHNKAKNTNITVVTSKKNDIVKFLNVHLMFSRSYTVEDIKTGINKNKKYKLEFIIPATEADMLVPIFRQIDDKAIVTINNVDKVSGRMYRNWFE